MEKFFLIKYYFHFSGNEKSSIWYFFNNFNGFTEEVQGTYGDTCIAQVVRRIETRRTLYRESPFFSHRFFPPSFPRGPPSPPAPQFLSFLFFYYYFFFSFSLSLFFFSPRAMHMIIVVGNRQSIDARRCRPFPPPTADPPPTCPTVYIPFQFNSYISRHLLAHSALEILLSLPIIIYRYARERERERARREKEKKIPEVISNVHNVFLLLRETRSLSYSVFCYWGKKLGRRRR